MLDFEYLDLGGVMLANSTENPAQNDVEDKIQKWLTEEGWQVTQRTAPELRFSFLAEDEAGRKILVAQQANRPDRILIQATTILSDEQARRFSALSQKKRQEFLWDVRFSLLQTDVEFAGLSDPLTQIRVGEPIFYDALTKDLFMQRFSEVKKAMLLVLWKVAQVLQEPPPTMGYLKG